MNREELIEKMCEAYITEICGRVAVNISEPTVRGVAAALDVAVGELLQPVQQDGEYFRTCSKWLLLSRISRYSKPKSAEDGVRELLAESAGHAYGLLSPDLATKIVAAVRAADKSLA